MAESIFEKLVFSRTSSVEDRKKLSIRCDLKIFLVSKVALILNREKTFKMFRKFTVTLLRSSQSQISGEENRRWEVRQNRDRVSNVMGSVSCS